MLAPRLKTARRRRRVSPSFFPWRWTTTPVTGLSRRETQGIAGRSARRRYPGAIRFCFYPTAAARQEAGFRPCLRCRPETVPELGAWQGTASTVSRALGLIEDGGLDVLRVDGWPYDWGSASVNSVGCFGNTWESRQSRWRKRAASCWLSSSSIRRNFRWSRLPWQPAFAAFDGSTRSFNTCSAVPRAHFGDQARPRSWSVRSGAILSRCPTARRSPPQLLC